MGEIKERWEGAEIHLLVELKKKGLSSAEIARALKDQFGTKRSINSINSKYYGSKKSGRLTVEEPEIAEETEQMMAKKLMEYDGAHVNEVLKEREDFLYGLMADQANALRLYDSLRRYERLGFGDLMALDLTKRREIIRILENPKERPDISNIGLLYRSIPRDGFSLVLPVYLVDVRGESEKGLASCLNDSVLGVIIKDLGIKPSRNTQDRFRDLVKYNFGNPTVDNKKIGNRVTELVQREHPSIRNIYVLEDRINFLDFSETE